MTTAAIADVLTTRSRDVGDFDVRRALPSARRKLIGPFIFFDQMGPVTFEDGQAMDVRPHPHIGLATVTWLTEGALRHQDSLGVDQVIRPGEVNLMTAGRGIVHSERTPAEARDVGATMAGIQTWLALPRALAEMEPAFDHYPAEAIPSVEIDGVQVTLIMGSGWGVTSPVKTYSETLYAELRCGVGSTLALDGGVAERAIYVLTGALEIDGRRCEPGEMIVLETGTSIDILPLEATHAFLIGGAPIDGERIIWWNFVASTAERLEQAKADWKGGRFPQVPNDAEYIPLPER
ncbi:MAG: pirin family protein [Pseudomonadota bacterium]